MPRARTLRASSRVLLAAALLALAALADEPAHVAARRARIVGLARAYAAHRWIAGPANVLHGPDADGVLVHTPDAGHHPEGWHADGRVNTGVPYKWGGFDSLASFDAAVAAGRPAGELTDADDRADSRFAAGVDCSGLVARCWELPDKPSTRSLGRLCVPLDDLRALRPGDLINKPDAHAMLVLGFDDAAREQVRVIEAVAPRVREAVHPVDLLARAGFEPLRYAPLHADWRAPPAALLVQARTTAGG